MTLTITIPWWPLVVWAAVGLLIVGVEAARFFRRDPLRPRELLRPRVWLLLPLYAVFALVWPLVLWDAARTHRRWRPVR